MSADLPDGNVWLALVVQDHPRHSTARRWWMEDAADQGMDPSIATGRLPHGQPPAPIRGPFPRDADAKARMASKLRSKKGFKTYAQRMAIVEPVNGQKIKLGCIRSPLRALRTQTAKAAEISAADLRGEYWPGARWATNSWWFGWRFGNGSSLVVGWHRFWHLPDDRDHGRQPHPPG